MRVFSTVRLFAVAGASALALLVTNPLFAQIPDPGSEGKQRLPWLKSMSEALQQAQTDKKPILIDITTDWCGWSKKMERETFADADVQKALRSFILVRINPESSEANEQLAKTYGADSYPTFIIANYRGEEIGNDSGYSNAKGFVTFLQRYQASFKGNPLGYKAVQLDATDPLMKAIKRIPTPDARPTSIGSFIVLDQTTAQVQPNGSAKYTVRTSTYVYDTDKPGLPDVYTYYVSSREKVKLKSVRIVDTKGNGRELDVKLAKDKNSYSSENMYWDLHTVSLPLPTLKEGQILDVIEERETQPIMPNEFFFVWNTGTKILLSSDFTLTFPASLKLEKRNVRCKGEVQETKNADGTITWQLLTSNRKLHEPDLFAPAFWETWEGYEFFTPCTKDTVAVWFEGLCKGQDVLPFSAEQKIASLKRANKNQTALLQAIFDWVTKDIRYVSVDLGKSSHQPHPVSVTLTNQYGDCKDQSLLLQALCKQAGISASMVLLDAFGQGVNQQNPSVERFNHCIVEATVDGKTYYLDPAAGPAKLGRVPALYAGTTALKVDHGTGKIVTLPPYVPQMEDSSYETVVHVNPNGSATITETMKINGEPAAKAKELAKKFSPEKARQRLEDSFKKTGYKLVEFFMTPTNSPGSNYETRVTYTAPRFGSTTAGGVAFKMMQGSRSSYNWIERLDMPRTQPFRFRASDSSMHKYTVELPEGAVLKGQPKDLEIDTPFMKATRKVTFENNNLSVTENCRLLDVRLDAIESKRVYSAFRKLRDHSEFTYIVEMPAEQLSAGR